MNITKVMESSNTEMNKGITRIMKGVILAIVVTLIMLTIYSVVLTYSSIGESSMGPVITIVSAVSILIGSVITASKMKKNGLVNGALIGLIYILLIYILASITQTGFRLNIYSLIIIISSIMAGTLGGIIGVNIK